MQLAPDPMLTVTRGTEMSQKRPFQLSKRECEATSSSRSSLGCGEYYSIYSFR